VSLPTIRLAEQTHEERERKQPVTRNLGRRVLVVDDGVDAADSTAALLTIAGCVTRVVYSGAEALAQTIDFKPVIVLLDIGMPAVDGLAVCRQIRSLPEGKSLFIVAITGGGRTTIAARPVTQGSTPIW
jgi:CheY-like chemotaxis protein